MTQFHVCCTVIQYIKSVKKLLLLVPFHGLYTSWITCVIVGIISHSKNFTEIA